MKKDRRKFLRFSAVSLLASLAAPYRKAFAQTKNSNAASFPELVALREGSPAQMFEIGIAALGGMERFVRPGQTVLIKPNIGWNKTPADGANTSPDLVGKITELVVKAGAAKVSVFDNTCNDMRSCYENSGIEEAVKKAGGRMYPGDIEKYYRKVSIPGAKILKSAQVHDLYLDSDVIINVPVLKHHVSTRMTCGLKNLMGVVWDRRFWHREGLNQCIADFGLLKKINLTVVDAYNVMLRNGPRGISANDLVQKRMQLLSADPVLADTAAAKILGASIEEVKYITLAESFGYGSKELVDRRIKRITCKA